MLFTKAFNIQNIFFQTINYFICLISADTDGGQEHTQAEDDKIFLTQEITHEIIDKANLSTTFPEKNSGSVLLCSLTDKVMAIDLLKKKLSKATLYIKTTKSDQTINKFKIGYELSTNNQTNKLDILIMKANWDSLETDINSSQDRKLIEFYLENPLTKTSIHLVAINCINEKQIKICKFFKFPDIEYLENCVERNKPFYHKSYQEYLFGVLEILPKQITEKKTAISNTKTSILLHVDMSPIVLLYSTKYTPSFTFFNEFSIKLKPLFLEDFNNDKSLNQFTCKPSIFLEVSQLADNRRDKISLQIFKYKYLENTQRYSNFDISDPFSYINLEFGSDAIDTQIEEISLFSSIRALETSFDFTMEFFKVPETWDSKVDEYFKNSLKQIKIEILGLKKSPMVLQNNDISTFINNDNIIIQFKVQDSPIYQINQEFKKLFNILKERKGTFSIRVRMGGEIIIEYKVFLSDDMLILFSNRIREHISFLKAQCDAKDVGISLDLSIKNRNIKKGREIQGCQKSGPTATHHGLLQQSADNQPTTSPRLSNHFQKASCGDSKTEPFPKRGELLPNHTNSFNSQKTWGNVDEKKGNFQGTQCYNEANNESSTYTDKHPTNGPLLQDLYQDVKCKYSQNKPLSNMKPKSLALPNRNPVGINNTYNSLNHQGIPHTKNLHETAAQQETKIDHTPSQNAYMGFSSTSFFDSLGQSIPKEPLEQQFNKSIAYGGHVTLPIQQNLSTPNVLNINTMSSINPELDTHNQTNGDDTSKNNKAFAPNNTDTSKIQNQMGKL